MPIIPQMEMPLFQAFDVSTGIAVPLSGGLLYSYRIGTDIPKPLYTDLNRQIEHTNPVVLDSEGKRVIYRDGDYKLKLHTADDAEIWTMDVPGIEGFISTAVTAAAVTTAAVVTAEQYFQGNGQSAVALDQKATVGSVKLYTFPFGIDNSQDGQREWVKKTSTLTSFNPNIWQYEETLDVQGDVIAIAANGVFDTWMFYRITYEVA